MYYPRSFLKLILLGFLLVSVPLLWALAESVFNLDRLAAQSRQAVVQAEQTGRAARQFLEQATALERVVRQYFIFEDVSLLEDYARIRVGFRRTADQLQALPLEEKPRQDLLRLIATEQELYAQLRTQQRNLDSLTVLADGYAGLTESAQTMIAAGNQVTENAITRLQETAARGRENWFWLTVAAAGIALVLAITFSILIAWPIRQIDRAIRQMGTADFTHAIKVNGPQDLRYLGTRLEWLRSRLEDLEQQQTRFLRHVSHELKTPLTAIREGAELLNDRVGGELSGEQREIVRIVRENTLLLQKLIEGLLKYQQNRAMEPRELRPVALVDIIRRVIREHKLAAYARAITIEAKLKSVSLLADAEKMRVIVDNLVSNAIKFSPRGGVVTLQLSALDGYAHIDVIDQGPGVTREDSERIFDTFYQGAQRAEGRVRGSGLGLAIAKEYVAAHGGEITVLPNDGEHALGGHFRVIIPIEINKMQFNHATT